MLLDGSLVLVRDHKPEPDPEPKQTRRFTRNDDRKRTPETERTSK
jgi:hypothetical protein